MNAPLFRDRPQSGHFSTPVFPAQANHYGTLFAGEALALMSQSALLTAADRAGGDVVMASCSGVSFRAPIRVGQVLHLTGRVVRTGRSSMTICVEGSAGAVGGRDAKPVLEGLFLMVAVDVRGRPRRIEPRGGRELA